MILNSKKSLVFLGFVVLVTACGTEDFTSTLGFDATTIEAGGSHTCAIRNGILKCVGAGTQGQLGVLDSSLTATAVDSLTPVAPFENRRVLGVATGNEYTCAIVNGNIWCFGTNTLNQLGDGTILTRNLPVLATVPNAQLSASIKPERLLAGTASTCALLSNKSLYCWGNNAGGVLGAGANASLSTVTIPAGLFTAATDVIQVALGSIHACVVRSGGVGCFGENGSSQLGNQATVDLAVGAAAIVTSLGASNDVQMVATGESHSCAVVRGEVWCWGSNANGQYGNGTTTTPVTANNLPSRIPNFTGVSAIFAKKDSTCAIKNGGLYCWGANGTSQLGDGTTDTQTSPTEIFGEGAGVTQVSMGVNGHTCAVVAGSFKCWGLNSSGQLGNGTTTSSRFPEDFLF